MKDSTSLIEPAVDLMLDLETLGLKPDINPIIQIACTPFDLNTQEVFYDQSFDRCLQIPSDREVCLTTLGWWKNTKSKRVVLEDILGRAEPVKDVMIDFMKYLADFGKPVYLWAKPTHFEHPFLQSYMKKFNIPLTLLHYRNARDLNSYIAGLHGSRERQKYEDNLEFEGDSHNALDDVKHQILTLFAAIEGAKK